MTTNSRIFRVAIATPLRRLFDYLPPDNNKTNKVLPGMRVSIPFGKRKETIGLIISSGDTSEYPLNKLKRINYIIDDKPLLDSKHLDLLVWASRYYHHSIGEVAFNALPTLLRKNQTIEKVGNNNWKLSNTGKKADPNEIKKSPNQAQILNYFQQKKSTINESELQLIYPRLKPSLAALETKGLIERDTNEANNEETKIIKSTFSLNKEQDAAIETVVNCKDKSPIYLLDGLTGSGKTEVYMGVIEHVIKSGKQCLILLPEIGLTPQLIQRFKDRFKTNIAIQHSGLSDVERLQYWQDARNGKAKLVLGTRSAVWTPLSNPGLYIIDEEHDLSYKQQDGFRYSARDMLIIRAKRDKSPIILGSATPSLESLYNVKKNRYEHLILSSRAGKSRPPEFRLLDIRGKKMHGALSQSLVDEIQQHLKAKNQVLLFLNRRGYAVHLYCHQCAWKAECPRCELPYTYHKSSNHLSCHHCGSNKRNVSTCPECGETLLLLGHGTERIEEVLKSLFPQTNIARIDRDSTRKKGAMATLLEKINSGEIEILIGTQMLAKGHHFPNVTLTAIIDADRGLFSTDFRASERLAQLFMQVSGRTGRGTKPGTVIVQTYNPEHPLFHQLIQHGYSHFSNTLQDERRGSALPPYTYMAFLRTEAHNSEDAKRFISNAAMQLNHLSNNSLTLFGPIPALIEKRSGRFRFQLIIQSTNRNELHRHLDDWLLKLESMRSSKKVRWSLDIDPQDMS